MNSILMIIIGVIVVMLIFIMFSLEDQEEESETIESPADDPLHFERVPNEDPGDDGLPGVPPVDASPGETGSRSERADSRAADSDKPVPLRSRVRKAEHAGSESGEPGSEEDLGFRIRLEDNIPLQIVRSSAQAVVAFVQLRFPNEILSDPQVFAAKINPVSDLLSPGKPPFPFDLFPGGHLGRICIFESDDKRDDALFEALVDAFDLMSRFKKLLDHSSEIAEAKIRLSIGISCGEIFKVRSGPVGAVQNVGKPVYLAETLAEAAGDMQIYVDDQIHKQAMPIFDFREWKPVKLRSHLPAIAFFELVGWNKKDEIFAFAAGQEVTYRRAVAVAYRYLEFDDYGPLLGLLSDSEERVALDALDTIAELGEEKALGILKRILPDARNPQIRSAIMKAFGSIRRDEVVPILLASTKDMHWKVRFHAAGSLNLICGKDAIKHIEPMIEDEDGAVRACIHRIMFQNTGKESHFSALNSLLTDLSGRARRAAIEALMEIGTDQAMSAVVDCYFDQDSDLRRTILRLLSSSRYPATYRLFLRLFRDADENDRQNIVTAVRRSNMAA